MKTLFLVKKFQIDYSSTYPTSCAIFKTRNEAIEYVVKMLKNRGTYGSYYGVDEVLFEDK